jgi:peptidoglycan/LPS O-acetylase OafA/YrhL
MKVVHHKNISKHSLVIESIFNMDFIVSAIIPIIIFSNFSELKMTLDGIILSAVWSIGVVLVSFVKENKINALAAIAGIFSFIGLIGTIISRNPTFYLISPIVQPIIAALCIGSMVTEQEHPYIQLTLTFDHRPIDGAYCGKFLHAVKTLLENPDSFISDVR